MLRAVLPSLPTISFNPVGRGGGPGGLPDPAPVINNSSSTAGRPEVPPVKTHRGACPDPGREEAPLFTRGRVGAARPLAARRGKAPAGAAAQGRARGSASQAGAVAAGCAWGISLHNSHPLSYLTWSPSSGLRFWTSSPSAQASGLSRWDGRVMVHQTTLGVHRKPWNRYTGNSGDKKMGSSGI